MNQYSRKGLLTILAALVLSFAGGSFPSAHADEQDLFTATSVQPNVLIILDNSNSMDQDFYGNAIGSFKTGSRSVEGRRALVNVVNTYANQLRIGLMTYYLPAASKYYLHENQYFTSYDPATYCPTPPAECDTYCRTGDATAQATCQSTCVAQNPSFNAASIFTSTTGDDIVNTYTAGSEQRNRYCNLIYPKTQRRPNPTDTSNYIYAKTPGTLYSSTNYGNVFCYSSSYNASESVTDNYSCYKTKTGTTNASTGYSSFWFSSSFIPTDEDVALGFSDFGRRNSWQYSGRTWFANSSPGGGQLHRVCNENGTDNAQLNALLAKLATKESDETGYMACTNTSNPNACAYIVNAGLTPTAGTFQTAYNYFTGAGSYTSPIEYWCQKHNYIIYVTDGLPSVNESGSTGTATALMPTVLQKIQNLRNITRRFSGTDYNYEVKTFVLGVGLTADAKTQIDAMAVAGGTATDGHAYYADNPAQLVAALDAILRTIIEGTYSFSSASVASTRTESENYLYEASFEPKSNVAYWPGHLKKYVLCSNSDTNSSNDCAEGVTEGNLTGPDLAWCNGTGDAAVCLQNRAHTDRSVYTFKGGSLTAFNATNITAADLGVSDDARLPTIGFTLGDSTYKTDNLKLGDVFHSNPITVGKPSAYYYASGFGDFRTAISGRTGIVVVGANDGQFHAFRTSDGQEAWSFIPPNIMPYLNSVRTGTAHRYLVDGAVMVVDTNLATTGWTTTLLFGLGRGGSNTLWSSSSSCDSGFSPTYSAGSYTHYCGYYVFDVTRAADAFTSSGSHPAVLADWVYPVIKPTDAGAPYLGEPWSRITAGKLKISGVEKWVGFFGGGYNGISCSGGGTCDTRGKGFFAIDLNNGNVIWSYTHADNGDMDYSLPGHPAIADTDNDGYIDTAYIGDIGGNMWRMKFCSRDGYTSDASCGTSSWTGGLLFNATSGGEGMRPVYSYPTVTRDSYSNLWVYWVTGDKTDPTASSTNEKVLGIKDNDRTTTRTLADLDNVSSETSTCSQLGNGWYINFTGREKALTDITIFGGIVYFTTFVPPQGADACGTAGESRLYAIDYRDCSGALPGETSEVRSISLGAGMASAPMISIKPGMNTPVDLYVTRSGGGGQGAATIRVPFNPPTLSNKANMIYWKDRRLQ